MQKISPLQDRKVQEKLLPIWTGSLDDVGIYVHIPFCFKKCPYCDFVSGPVSTELRRRYLLALKNEISSTPWVGSYVKTIFWGGGTPSDLTPFELSDLSKTIQESFDLSGLEEATIECNPETLTEKKLSSFLECGFNRISLGVQSFQDYQLNQLGRLHTVKDNRRSLNLIMTSGFKKINLDLMFALPQQTLKEWDLDLVEALSLDPGHISLYQLTFEPETDFFNRMRRGEIVPPDTILVTEMLEAAMVRMTSFDYLQYEISNFARSGFECLHNQRYWTNKPTLGFGVSASSYVEGVRWTNTRQVSHYTKKDGNSPPLDSVERLNLPQALGEEMLLRLRTREGADLNDLKTRYGQEALNQFTGNIDNFKDKGLLSMQGSRLCLTQSGRMLADTICMEFL